MTIKAEGREPQHPSKYSVRETKTALFGGGCFWCMEKPFDELEGVIQTLSGYAGGAIPNPSYEEVSTGQTGHREVVQVTYDPAQVSYRALLERFWQSIDPFDPVGQFCDKGTQYKAGIFVNDDAEREEAESFKTELEEKFQRPIETDILPAAPFYPAEEYHQKYYRKNPERYQRYAKGSGRTDSLNKIWGAGRKDKS